MVPGVTAVGVTSPQNARIHPNKHTVDQNHVLALSKQLLDKFPRLTFIQVLPPPAPPDQTF